MLCSKFRMKNKNHILNFSPIAHALPCEKYEVMKSPYDQLTQKGSKIFKAYPIFKLWQKY
jgi:hypothetical protein